MERIAQEARTNWVEAVERLGFMYHNTDQNHRYWYENAAYKFKLEQIHRLEMATLNLYEMYIQAVDWLIESSNLSRIGIPEKWHKIIKDSWENDELSIYGRFDLCYDGVNPPKMLEFNADTPTSLFEASVVQWDWLQTVYPKQDQFNSIHEKLISAWKYTSEQQKYQGRIHFSCIKDSLEDLSNVEYMRDCAIQAGVDTEFIYVNNIGWNDANKEWRDMDDKAIKNIFKLYPWEWMMAESFGEHVLENKTMWIEPAWKAAMSSKAMLAILWEMFPHHENLLPTYFESEKHNLGFSFVSKPFFSREGAGVVINDALVIENKEVDKFNKSQNLNDVVYQEICYLPDVYADELGYMAHPVIGSWVIGGEPAGIGIRESDGYITDNLSRFIPHYIEIPVAEVTE